MASWRVRPQEKHMDLSTLRPSLRLLPRVTNAVALAVMLGCVSSVVAQQSVGRGRPMAGGAEWVGAGVPFYNIDAATAKDGTVPQGVTPLARDIFTSDDFYVDRELWRDPR
ncbi:MAG TPA: hypothetical protein VM692_04405 [Gammaproteobacteria bacterium]|nr:hypothetical protein [Gammaproteobacteria bacterium]